MDANNKLLSASLVQWQHNGKQYTEELRNRRGMPGPSLDLVERITIASWVFEDVMSDDATVTKIWFGGRQHKLTEDQLHSLKMATHNAEVARGEILEAVGG